MINVASSYGFVRQQENKLDSVLKEIFPEEEEPLIGTETQKYIELVWMWTP